jgi:endoglucanase
MTPSRVSLATTYRILAGIAFLLFSAMNASAFEMRRAVNVAQWFTWPRYETPPNTGIMWPPYKETPRPLSLDELRDLKQAGFDTVRLPVDPAPFFVFQGLRREEVYRLLFAAIERIHGAGLNVIVDLHPNSRHPVWGQHAVVRGLEEPAFVSLAGVVEEMARRLSTLDARRVALELINEPRLKCAGDEQSRWQGLLDHLVTRARAAAPQLALIVTGSCISTLDGLMALDVKVLRDSNLIYTFHYYEPFSFTHQGAAFIPWPDKYLDEVPWPAGARPIDGPRQKIDGHVAKATNLDAVARTKAALGARLNLEKFYASGASRELIEKRFALVFNWAKANEIPPERIFIGEFGVLRKNGDAPGALCEDRMRWLADVRQTAERFGFLWAYFSYDGPFALVKDDRMRTLDPAVLGALGLTRTAAGCKDAAR